MNATTRRLTLGSLMVLTLASGAGAAEPSTDVQSGNRRQATAHWVLSTDDTELVLSVSNHKTSEIIWIDGPAVPAPSP
jgi:hypothetical protein